MKSIFLLLPFALLICNICFGQAETQNAKQVLVLKLEVDSLSKRLNGLQNSTANATEIRKIKILLEDKKNELEKLMKYSSAEVKINGFSFIKEAYNESLVDVGKKDAWKTCVSKLTGNTVRLRGIIYDAWTVPKILSSWRELDSLQSRDEYILKNQLNSIFLFERNALRKNDYSRLLDAESQWEYDREKYRVKTAGSKTGKNYLTIVEIEGVIEMTNNYNGAYNPKETYRRYYGNNGTYVDEPLDETNQFFYLKDWVIVSIEN